MAKSRKGKKRHIAAAQVAVETESKAQTATPCARASRRERARWSSRSKKQERLLVAGLLVITFLAFANSLDGEFLYDDRYQVLKNPTINKLSNIPSMFTQNVWQFMNPESNTPASPYYRPLFNVALIVNYQLFGLNVLGWHLFSVLLHLLVTYMVYRLARQWDMSQEAGLAAAFLFGLHPVHSESVAWISGVPDPVAGVFILGSLLLYERHYHGKRGHSFLLPASAGLAVLAMFSKEVAIAFPIFLAAREWLDREEGEPFTARLRRLALRVAPFAAAAAVYLVARYAVLGFLSSTDLKAARIPNAQVLLTLPSVLLGYARLFFIPYPLAVMYDHSYVSSAADPRFWGAALAVAAIVTAMVFVARRYGAGIRASIWAVLFLLPVLNLKAFNPQESLLHDRYLYLPSVGLCLIVAIALARLGERLGERQQTFFQTATVLIGVILMLLTVYQNPSWQNNRAMAAQAFRVTPKHPYLHNYIGAYYSEERNFAEAEKEYLTALEFNPTYYDALSNLGDVYREQGKANEAETYYLKAIEYGAPYANTHYNLGVVYTNQGRLQQAEQPLLKALEIEPSYTKARYNLGWVYYRQGKTAPAEQAYQETLKYDPTYPEPRINLAILLTAQNRYNEAVDHLKIAQRYAPDHHILLYALGDVYLKMNRYEEAITAFDQLARRDPRHNLVHTGLGLCYERLGNKEQAKIHFQKAIEVAPQNSYTDVARQRLAQLGSS
ncbi:MAG: tetratricopeptide repeat protein [Blastocatellia bacterium]|nr:tetratricopeptide repeat protein [Blastocatellia bacterium]